MPQTEAVKAKPRARKANNGLVRKDLVVLLAKTDNLTQAKAESVVNNLLNSISNTVRKGGSVRIKGFGSFVMHKAPSRMGRNPKTGDSVRIPVRKSMKFRAAAHLRDL